MPKEHEGFVLLIEDNRPIAEALAGYLESAGYSVDYAGDGVTGLALASQNRYDCILLDVALPGMDGLQVARTLRAEGQLTPILMVTARDSLDDKVEGLTAGADDYLVKPFDTRELRARLRALIRRERQDLVPQRLSVGDLVLDTGLLTVSRAGTLLSVPPVPLKVLTLLMKASPRIVSRDEIERQIWGDALPDSDTLRSHLYVLRNVVDKPFESPLIHTVHTSGYRIADLQALPDTAQVA